MTVISRAGAADPRRLKNARAANQSTARGWAQYATHRARVTDLIARHAPPRGHATSTGGDRVLCVLGAGNCNDLELTRLAATFDRIHLVDLDADALRGVASRQRVLTAELRAHGGTDLSVLTAEEVTTEVGERVDVVASTALLSQIIADAHDDREHDPLTVEDLVSVRAAHLNQMAALLRPGGWGVLVNDLVSSTTVPNLAAVPDRQLPNLLRGLLEAGNFFTGSNPYAVCAQLTWTASPGDLVGEVTLHPPWVWQMSEQRSRLTYAVTFRRHHDLTDSAPRRRSR